MRHLIYGHLYALPAALALSLACWLHWQRRPLGLEDLAVVTLASFWGAWVGWASTRQACMADADDLHDQLIGLQVADWERRKADLRRGRNGARS